MYRTSDLQTLNLSQPMDDDFTSGLWDVRGIECGLIEMAWTGFVNSGTASTVKLEITCTKQCWCGYSETIELDPSETCAALALPMGHPAWFARILYTAGDASAGTMTIVAGGKVVMDNGISGGNS